MKILGLSLLLFAVGYIGFFSVRHERERPSAYAACLAFLKYIRTGIADYHKPIPAIIHDFDNEYLQKIGFLTQDGQGNRRWNTHVLEEKAVLFPDDLGMFTRFLSELGSGFLGDEIRRCDEAIAAMAAGEKKSLSEAPRKSRIYGTLSVGGALLLLLVFM